MKVGKGSSSYSCDVGEVVEAVYGDDIEIMRNRSSSDGDEGSRMLAVVVSG